MLRRIVATQRNVSTFCRCGANRIARFSSSSSSSSIADQSENDEISKSKKQQNNKKRINESSKNGSRIKGPASYSSTLNLPKSQFAMKHSRSLELEIEKIANFDDLYRGDRPNKDQRSFVLHDGPPYANGDAHFGHCINKTLKDIFLRRAQLDGRADSSRHRHGWDCHGLPIELKACTEAESWQLSALEIRDKARLLASDAIERQRAAFRTWHLVGDLDRPYRTYDIGYSLRELEIFYKLFRHKLIFRDYMPVYYSPSTRTALAEAELQYRDDHVSKSAFVAYRISNFGLPLLLPDLCDTIYALIWTTTPWTLLANEAIAFSESIDYCLLRSSTEAYLVATELVPLLRERISLFADSSLTPVLQTGISGTDLRVLRYEDPLDHHHHHAAQSKPFLPAAHVSLSKGGTGLVHLAPNHGFDDYKLFAIRPDLRFRKQSIVDHFGNLRMIATDEKSSSSSSSVSICDDHCSASEYVLRDILPKYGIRLLAIEDYRHSFPYDWRSGKPVLIKPSSQWFLSIDTIRSQCLDALEQVKIYPEKLRKEMRHQIATRPNWCLSRQRNWGVPIPVFYDARADPDRLEPILSEDMFRCLLSKFSSTGSLDCWWQLSASELLDQNSTTSKLVKSSDIFDIWFDSGCSWAAVLDDHMLADLYCEGIDQIRGWFQSSLITSVALRGHAPYRGLFIHGFALDKDGRKMSKSIGNVIDPRDIIESKAHQSPHDHEKLTKAKKQDDGCGVDGLRYWIAKYACSHADVHVDLRDFDDEIRTSINRIRNTIRFLLGVLAPETKRSVSSDHAQQNGSIFTIMQKLDQIPLLDKYLFAKCEAYLADCRDAYDRLQLSDVIEATQRFVLHDLATFYLTRVKDRLYCDDRRCSEYGSAAAVLRHSYHTIGYCLAPILPHIIVEANRTLPFERKLAEFELPKMPERDRIDQAFSAAHDIIQTLNRWNATSGDRMQKLGEFELTIAPKDMQFARKLKIFKQFELIEILQVAAVTIIDDWQSFDFADSYRENENIIILNPLEYSDEQIVNDDEESSNDLSPEEQTTSLPLIPQFELKLSRTDRKLCDRCRRHCISPPQQTSISHHTSPPHLCVRCTNVMSNIIENTDDQLVHKNV